MVPQSTGCHSDNTASCHGDNLDQVPDRVNNQQVSVEWEKERKESVSPQCSSGGVPAAALAEASAGWGGRKQIRLGLFGLGARSRIPIYATTLCVRSGLQNDPYS